MNIIVAALVRNEADRFLESALAAWTSFADHVFVIDDHSTDDTKLICNRNQKVSCITSYHDGQAWGNESLKRKELFDYAWSETFRGDYILVLDADMVPAKDPRQLLISDPDAVAFNLYDLWELRHYREDFMWRAHLSPRVWMVKRPDEYEWTANRGIHSGHLPSIDLRHLTVAPPDYGILHYGYLTEAIRAEKLTRYRSVGMQLSPEERRHADSITDERPFVKSLGFTPTYELSLREWGKGGNNRDTASNLDSTNRTSPSTTA